MQTSVTTLKVLRYQTISIQENIIPNDTTEIYLNYIGKGDRKETTTTTRSIVKNNELYRLGIPLAIGWLYYAD